MKIRSQAYYYYLHITLRIFLGNRSIAVEQNFEYQAHYHNPVTGSEGAVATEKLEIVASRIIKKYGKKSTRITLSAKADIPGKGNEDKTGIVKAIILTRENPPKENILTPINDSMRSHVTPTETHTNTTKKKPWNFLKFLFGNKQRK